ncbi:MAG: hypothetical protein ACFB0C_22495 [Leptolyngbyaceae cyanobacterium]
MLLPTPIEGLGDGAVMTGQGRAGQVSGLRLKAKEVLRLYAAGERDFRGAILRGCNVKLCGGQHPISADSFYSFTPTQC